MVLKRAVILLALVGCKQSLFDGNPSGTDASVGVPATCPDSCVGDLAGDFNSPNAHLWRYVEDNRKHVWSPMPVSNGIATGATAANTIATCDGSDAAACSKLPGALLISSAGAQLPADPAVELTITTPQVIRIDLAAYLDTGASQGIRLYRNSREDVLYTGSVDPGTTTTSSITIDALAGDRILVAIAPTAAGAKDLGLQLFVSNTGSVFPSDCLLALEFPPATSAVVKNNCAADFASKSYDSATDMLTDKTAGQTATSSYAELGSAASLKSNGTVGDAYISTAIVPRGGDTTTQLWFQWQGTPNDEFAWFLSDADYHNDGGLGLNIGSPDGTAITLGAYTSVGNGGVGITAGFSGDHLWHFLRVVYASGTMSMCLDGTFVKSMGGLPASIVTAVPDYVGYNHDSTGDAAYLTANLDDIRILHTALPCAAN